MNNKPKLPYDLMGYCDFEVADLRVQKVEDPLFADARNLLGDVLRVQSLFRSLPALHRYKVYS